MEVLAGRAQLVLVQVVGATDDEQAGLRREVRRIVAASRRRGLGGRVGGSAAPLPIDSP